MKPAIKLYRHLWRECRKLPEAPRKYYQFMVRQGFVQHLNETDPVRISEIISRSYEDAQWILKKYGQKG